MPGNPIEEGLLLSTHNPTHRTWGCPAVSAAMVGWVLGAAVWPFDRDTVPLLGSVFIVLMLGVALGLAVYWVGRSYSVRWHAASEKAYREEAERERARQLAEARASGALDRWKKAD